jgi:hypothetical protein
VSGDRFLQSASALSLFSWPFFKVTRYGGESLNILNRSVLVLYYFVERKGTTEGSRAHVAAFFLRRGTKHTRSAGNPNISLGHR